MNEKTQEASVGGKPVDPLLSCLVFLTEQFGHARSASAITAGVGYDSKNMGPSLFCEAAEKVGLKTKITKRKTLADIPSPVLPAVLILSGERACVLLGLHESAGKALVWFPASGEKKTVLTKELEKTYAGYALFVHPLPEFTDTESAQDNEADRHWFWGPVWDARDIYGNVLIAAALINVFALASPVFMMSIYNRVLPNHAM